MAVPDEEDRASLREVADTFARVLAGELGSLDEVALDGLDRVGTPVWAVWVRDAAGSQGGIGYGATREQARVSALGEAIEGALVERLVRASTPVVASYAQLVGSRGTDGVVDPRLLGLPAGVGYDDDRPLRWLPTRRERDGAEVLVPAELLAVVPADLTALPVPPPPGGDLLVPVTNGLGAGRSRRQAVVHGVLEVLQRDGNGLAIRSLDTGRVLDLAGVSDRATLEGLARLRAAGVEVVAKVAATDLGLPNLTVVGSAPDDDLVVGTAAGEGVHPDRHVALRKAVLEFASARARKAFMHGPLDAVAAVAPPGYLGRALAAVDLGAEEPRVLDAMVAWLAGEPAVEAGVRQRLRETVFAQRSLERFDALPTTPAPPGPSELLDDVLDRLHGAGFDVLASTAEVDGAHAAHVVVPGSEVETVAYGRIGERGVRRLLDHGRDDLVRVGDRPRDEGDWATVHLTAEGVDRLGGPAWLDLAALDRVADGLLPLYREPARHAAQVALARRR